MSQPNLKKKQEDISDELAISMETMCYQGWCEMLQVAYKKEGIVGVVGLAYETAKYADELAKTAEVEVPGCANVHRAIVAAELSQHWFPLVLENLKDLPDGPWFFELKAGGTTSYPRPGEELRTYSESLKIRDDYMSGFKDYARLQGTNPAAARELVQMVAAKYHAQK